MATRPSKQKALMLLLTDGSIRRDEEKEINKARRKGIEVKYIPVNFLKHDRDYFFKVFPHLFPASDIIEIPSYATLHTHLKDKLTKMACKVTEADFDAAMDP